MKHSLLLTTLLLATPALATTSTDDATVRLHEIQSRMRGAKLPPLTQPFFDADAAGAVWVRGDTYKASFDASGATFYPLFGSKTPRHFPLRTWLTGATSNGAPIQLDEARSAVRDGDRITIDRGAIDEVYEPELHGLEQSFVVESRPAGDLELVVGIDTELAPRETADGFTFANEYGSLEYGRAFVRDSSGARIPVETRLTADGIVIDVSADELARAQFPLVVDPFIGQFGLGSSALGQQLADIAYDASTRTFMVVFEEVAAANDTDVRTMTLDFSGTSVVATTYVDTTAQDWQAPSVANLNSSGRFLVVASVGGYPGYTVPGNQFHMAAMRGCIATVPSVFSIESLVLTSETGTNDRYDLSVGGDDAATGSTYFLVAWSEYIPGGAKIECRRVDSNFVPAGSVLTLSTGGDVRPSVSKSNGHTNWGIAWEHNDDLYGAQVSWNGSLTTSAFAVANSADIELDPHVASPFGDGSWAVAYARGPSTDHDVYCRVFTGSTLSTERNLSASTPSTQTLEQRSPAVDCDGERIVVSFCENKSSNFADFDVYASAYFFLGGSLIPSEIHVPIATTTTSTNRTAITSTRGVGNSPHTRRFGIAYTLLNTTNPDVFGALYDLPEGGTITSFCTQDVGAIGCPCGNNGSAGRGCANALNSSGAKLSGSGIASISHDTVVLAGDGMTNSSVLYFQGTNQPGNGVTFGDGVRCTVGSIVRLGIKTNVAGSSSFPSGADPRLSVKGAVTSATTHTYQCWYRDPASFCSASTFNLTNALYIVWAQ